MYISKLEVTNVRNLRSLSVIPHRSTNFVIGPNGSGKTSLLESISLLSNGRSFRTNDSKKLINQGADRFIVFSTVVSESTGSHRVGISKDIKGNTVAKLDGVIQSRVSALAKVLPILSVDTNSIELIEGGPALRRSILDWGMFHVEHSFLDVWSQYRDALKQKNALLKSGRKSIRSEIHHWNSIIAQYGERLDLERIRYTDELEIFINRILNHYFKILDKVKIRYKNGWDKNQFPTLRECLDNRFENELQRNSCLYGPHRADLDILWEGTLCKDICSRGQKKLVLYGVRLAQIALMVDRIGITPILLLDDLPAELDVHNINNVFHFLNEFPCQTFITAINDQLVTNDSLSVFEDHKMFHVEHGTFKETR